MTNKPTPKEFCSREARRCVYYYPDTKRTTNEGSEDCILVLKPDELGITIHPGQSYCWLTGKVWNADGTEDTNGHEA